MHDGVCRTSVDEQFSGPAQANILLLQSQWRWRIDQLKTNRSGYSPVRCEARYNRNRYEAGLFDSQHDLAIEA